MPDIGLVWDPLMERGDWARDGDRPLGADDGTDGDLTAAVLVSLLTDGRADDDFVLTDGTTNRRGCWTDTYEEQPIGSRLWQLERSRTTTIGRRDTAVLLAARDYCREALQWLLDDEIATGIAVDTFWARSDALGIVITVARAMLPDATITTNLPLSAS